MQVAKEDLLPVYYASAQAYFIADVYVYYSIAKQHLGLDFEDGFQTGAASGRIL